MDPGTVMVFSMCHNVFTMCFDFSAGAKRSHGCFCCVVDIVSLSLPLLHSLQPIGKPQDVHLPIHRDEVDQDGLGL